ncbi:AHH domain-containing protein [Tsuneonella mangrovi]|uniref:AHH domain-containing protein n=1 Tax=Tsuneonella mangrovi TaxID=1982042 RepID=UPI000BA2934A|nr:AHH domain-containing protein [Tsuneonella mangrovi]
MSNSRGRHAANHPARARLPFRKVNRPDGPGYDPALQRHHLLPRQVLLRRCFGRMFEVLGHRATGFNDFRRNGLLLPSRREAAIRLGLPMHRGPHRAYNAMVLERVGQIEERWAAHETRDDVTAGEEALMRLALLQRALRRRLLDPPGEPIKLNSKDPVGTGFDFAELDAMAEGLWSGTQSIFSDSSSFAR